MVVPALIIFSLAAIAATFFVDRSVHDSSATVLLAAPDSAPSSAVIAAPPPTRSVAQESVEPDMDIVSRAPEGQLRGVHFPDGEVIEVRLRARPPILTLRNEHSTDLSLLEAFEELSEALTDNPAAAFKVHELKEHCDMIFEEERRTGHYDPQHYSGPWGTTTILDGSGRGKLNSLEAARRHIEECRTLTDQGIGDTDWLQKAVEGGSSDAFKMMGRRLGDTSAAAEMFEQAWQSGEIFSTIWLSSLYAKGFHTQDGQFVQDTKQALAYQYLFASLNSLKFQARGGSSIPFVQNNWNRVAELEQSLHPHERDEAYVIAKSLLHDGCCMK